jgi:chromosome segregation ATPase
MADAEVARLQQELNDSSSKCANLQKKLQSTQCRAQSRYRETLLANRRAEQLEGTISDKDFILNHEMTKRLSLERSLGAAAEQLRQLRKEKDEAVELQVATSDILGEGCTKHELEKQIQEVKAQTEHEMRMYKLAVDEETKKSRASWQDETRKEHEHIMSANQRLRKLCQDGQEETEKLKRSLKTLEKELTWHKNRLRQRAREESARVITHPIGSPSPMRDQKKRKLNEHKSAYYHPRHSPVC